MTARPRLGAAAAGVALAGLGLAGVVWVAVDPDRDVPLPRSPSRESAVGGTPIDATASLRAVEGTEDARSAPGPTAEQVAWLASAVAAYEKRPRDLGILRNIASLGPDAKGAAPALLRHLGTLDLPVRTALAQALAAMGPDVAPLLLEAAMAPDDDLRAGAVLALAWLAGPLDEPIAEALRRALRDPDADVRAAAATATAYATALLTGEFVAALSDPAPAVRATAAQSLGAAARGPRSAEAFAALVGRAGDGEEADAVRTAAIHALASYGEAAAPAVALLSRLADGDALLASYQALRTLALLGPHAREAVPTLLALARENEDADRLHLARDALAHVAPAHPDVLALAERWLEGDDSWRGARTLLWAGEEGIAVLRRAAADPATAHAFDDFPFTLPRPGTAVDWKRVVRDLTGLAEAEEASLAAAALRSLAAIDQEPAHVERAHVREVALDAVLRATRSESALVRVEAVRAAITIGRDSTAVGAALVRGLSDPDPQVRLASADGLGWIDAKTKDAALALAKCLSTDPDAEVRAAAAESLGEFRSWASSVRGSLRDAAASDAETSVRDSSRFALGRFEEPD